MKSIKRVETPMLNVEVEPNDDEGGVKMQFISNDPMKWTVTVTLGKASACEFVEAIRLITGV